VGALFAALRPGPWKREGKGGGRIAAVGSHTEGARSDVCARSIAWACVLVRCGHARVESFTREGRRQRPWGKKAS
jgi:hypothetical protein